MSQRMPPRALPGLWAISIAAICALCLVEASRWLEASNPALAATLNPANSEARVNSILARLNDPAGDLDLAERETAVLMGLSPADARGYSLMGALAERRGDAARAASFYTTALGHSKTEIHALQRLADASLASGDWLSGMEYVDLILRRWPDYWAGVAPIIDRAARDEAGRIALGNHLERMPPWRGRAIAQLARTPAGLIFAREIIVGASAAARARPGWRGEANTIISALAGIRAYREAHEVHLAALEEEVRPLAGPIFDKGFTQIPNRMHFGWRVTRDGSVDVNLPARSETGLLVRFFDAPAKPGGVSQNIVLEPGAYRLGATVSAVALEAPRQLYWRLACATGRIDLARLDIAPGTYAAKDVEVAFEVPETGCPAQRLSLDTDVRTDSWRDRYRGEVTFVTLQIHPR